MKAAVYHGKQDIRIEDVPVKPVGPDEVRIQVKCCGVCGTDIHIFNGDGGSFAVTPPLIPGHEVSGVVAELGADVTRLKIGEPVSIDPNVMCGKCHYCLNGMEHFCSNNVGIGTTRDGGFAEYLVMPASHVFRVPDGVDFETACMTEPMSCCLHGIDLCHIRAGDSVLVMGGGPIGILMMQLAQRAGAARVFLSEPVEEKRQLAMMLGASKTFNPLKDDLDVEIRKETSNLNCVIECIGRPSAQEDAVRLAGKGATVMFFGLAGPEDRISVKPDDIFKKELHITSSFINPYTFTRALETLATGVIDVKKIVAHIVGLEDLPHVLADPEMRRAGKVIVRVSE